MGALVTIDCEYVMPQLAASYLREEGGEVAFIEANTTHALPRLLAALERQGLAAEAVKYVIVTHVHLDHAGGASALMRACPNATLLAHPRAARHLIDPTRLVASARHVYGEEAFERLYGTIEAIDAARVRALEDGERVTLGGAPLHFLHTRGHANHHFVVHDEAKQVVYTGDAFGLVYPALQRGQRFAYPSTSPTDFDGAAAIASVKRVVELKPRAVALTHFGMFEDVQPIADQLIRWLELSTRMAEQGAKSGDDVGTLEQRFKWQLDQEFELAASRSGLKLNEADRQLIRFDSELNGQGLAAAAVKQRG
ncbi:MAG: MBL fold metallo-hydrolase [Archangium sp.]|nr:MBL fold metallo-hydrolase [Archangium sp.]